MHHRSDPSGSDHTTRPDPAHDLPDGDRVDASPWWRRSWGEMLLQSPSQVFGAVLVVALVVEITQESLRAAILPELTGVAAVAVGVLWLPVLLGSLLWVVVIRPLRLTLGGELASLAARDRDLTRQTERLEFDDRLHRALEMADNEDEVLRVVGRGMGEAALSRPIELLLADASDAHLRRAVAQEPEGEPPGCGVESPKECPAVRHGNTLQFGDSRALDACPHLEDRSIGRCAATCLPIQVMGRATGVLHTVRPHGTEASEEETSRLESLAARAGARLGMVRVLADTELQAATDPLTGLINRRTLENRFGEIAKQADAITVAMCDLDHFKGLNDRFGHDTGDRALRLFADVLREAVRPADLAARFGGEEFVVVLPDCSAADGRQVLERIRERLARTLATGEVPAFTVSIGAADTAATRDLSSLLKRADDALYLAKEAGRDRVVLSGEDPPIDLADARGTDRDHSG